VFGLHNPVAVQLATIQERLRKTVPYPTPSMKLRIAGTGLNISKPTAGFSVLSRDRRRETLTNSSAAAV